MLFVLGYSVWGEIRDGVYGSSFSENYSDGYRLMRFAPAAILAFWFVACTVVSIPLTRAGSFAVEEE